MEGYLPHPRFNVSKTFLTSKPHTSLDLPTVQSMQPSTSQFKIPGSSAVLLRPGNYHCDRHLLNAPPNLMVNDVD